MAIDFDYCDTLTNLLPIHSPPGISHNPLLMPSLVEDLANSEVPVSMGLSSSDADAPGSSPFHTTGLSL